MSIVITTATGHIGSELTRRLLEAGEKPTLIVRDPGKVAAATARGAKVAQGSLEDEAFVLEATKGATALFWLTPPKMDAPAFREYQRRLGAIAAKAVATNKIPRVVNLSSVGAQLPSGVGPVSGLHEVEEAIDRVAGNVTHLRAGDFMENILNFVGSIKSAGAFFLPVPAGVKLPMVATRDIAEVAARVLLDASWSGRRAVTVYGPEELSHAEVAAVLGEVLGRPIGFTQVTPDQARQAMLGMGFTADLVREFLELYDAFSTGRILQGLPAKPDLRGTTTFREFAATVIKPGF